ncbi:MAG TPA: hypothetical protein VEV81_12780 [Pyrinomonadaceae bacterium]|nr:hypothetical protein [Pyrinomonadaceae bacterium]
MSKTTKLFAAAILILSLIFAGCHKGGSEAKQLTPEEAKKNAELEKTAPHLAQTALGSVERINLSVSAATNAYREHKWADVTSALTGAKKETEKALAEIPDKKKTGAIRQSLEEMGQALDRTLEAANNRSQQVEGLLAELQTRTNALKMIVQPTQVPN